jgi:hypothetical protein
VKPFLSDFFRSVGATVEEKGPLLEVAIPAGDDASSSARELVRRFGRDRLVLAFDPHDSKAGVDLVAPGGHVLRTVEEFLASRGRRSYVVAPAVRKLEKSLVVEALAPAKKVKLVLEERTDDEAWDLHFTFRLRYRGRERKDALLDVLVPASLAGPGEPRAAPPPVEAGTYEARPRKHVPETVLKDAFAKALGLLDELASREALELEARARARLERDASRLELFYDTAVHEQQTNRTATDVARLKIEELEEERILKRKELVESARVDAEAEPLQLLEIERPRRRVLVRVARPRKKDEMPAEGSVELGFDLSTGEVVLPSCPACRKALRAVTVCEGSHVVHDGCARGCLGCGRVLCAACGAKPCARCASSVGPECAKVCSSCNETVCPEHLAVCARCGRENCTGCLHACAHCGELACESDRFALGEGTAAFLCGKCGQTCPGCGRVELETALGRCETCGRQFCTTCLPKRERACPTCRR